MSKELPTDPILRRMELQNREFVAMNELSDAWQTLRQVAVVDDDYPYFRSQYEVALRKFLNAVRENRPDDVTLGFAEKKRDGDD